MDGRQFDHLARTLAERGTSRRAVLRGIAGLAGGLLGVGASGALARTCDGIDRVCREHATCCSGLCGPKDRTGRRRCQCQSATDCPAASDQCHAPTCVDGVCDVTALTGQPCDDGNACTESATCQSGVCVGVNPVVCTASDQCHVAGVCDPRTGQCSNPVAPNNTPCDDGNACTQTDTCQNGVCVGSNPKTCPASDQCHEAGTCNPSTGECTNPAKTNGATCVADNNACTVDTCQAGVCTAGATKDCTTVPAFNDQCNVGVCNMVTGLCEKSPKPNTTSCDDGDACTQTDTCLNGVCTGSNPVVCSPLDDCHVAGTCNPATGTCSNPTATNGTLCGGGDLCTGAGTCQDGQCNAGTPVVCTALDQCHVAGECDPQTGLCSNPNAPNDTPCGSQSAGICTAGDSCQNGQCVDGGPVCSESQDCLFGNCFDTCSETSGEGCSASCKLCVNSVLGTDNFLCANPFPGGPCQTNDDCGIAFECVQIVGLDPVCVYRCDSAEACGEPVFGRGLACAQPAGGERGICIISC